MNKEELKEEALRLIAIEDKENHDIRVARKIRELEELKEYEDNKKLQNSDCPHTNKERWNHGSRRRMPSMWS